MALAARKEYSTAEELELLNTATSVAVADVAEDDISRDVAPVSDDDFAPEASSFARRRAARSAAVSPHPLSDISTASVAAAANTRAFREWKELQKDPAHDEAHVVRRKVRRPHRAVKLSPVNALGGTLLFSGLLVALYFKAMAVSSLHRADNLEKAIAVTEAEMDKTQRKIAVINADPRMGQWAEKAGYHVAAQADLDDVLNPQAWPPKTVETPTTPTD